jgi:antirestriction protein ArdC
MAKTSVYDVVTGVIIEKLERGVIPWYKPWKTYGEPRNLISGKFYRGINNFLLGCANHSSPYFLTFKQAQQLGGHIRKGEKSMPCIFWTEWEKEDRDTGEQKRLPVLRYYRLFSSEQCEDIDHNRLNDLKELEASDEFDPITEAEMVVDDMQNPPIITHAGSQACYHPSGDTVNMPDKKLFESAESYYSTIFHELGHSTGHKSRLDRRPVTEIPILGSYDYGQEELVAEMASAFLSSRCHIDKPVIDNQAAYIASWLRVIRKDSKLVVTAASQAQKAADYILGVPAS